jgi:tetratricopeptide (TPR) repeat protein
VIAVRVPMLILSAGLWSIGGAWTDHAKHLIERGNAAYDRGAFDLALKLYARAEHNTTDPGLVSFNKAAALYRLGRFAEAEAHYGRCVENAPLERAFRALYNAGNSAISQVENNETEPIKRAIGYYEHALPLAVGTQLSVNDVEHNLSLARSMLTRAQAAKAHYDSSDSHKADTRQSLDNTSPSAQTEAADGENPAGVSDRTGKLPVPTSKIGVANTRERRPGIGNLPVLPDHESVQPLSANETAAYLDEVAARVLRERAEHRRRSVVPPPPTFRDW